jgi:O-antigen ligase
MNLRASRNKSGVPVLLACIACGLAFGFVISKMSLLYNLALAGTLFTLFLTIKKPELSIIGIVIIIASVIDVNTLPLVPLGPGSLNVTDILVLVLLAMSFWRHLSTRVSHPATPSPVSRLLLLFMAYAVCTSIISIKYLGMDLNTVLRLFRVVSYYLLYFMITNLVTSKKQISFMMNALFCVAALVAATMLAQIVIGDSIQLIPGKQYRVDVLEQEVDAMRLQPPGQTLLLACLITVMALITNLRSALSLRSRYIYLLVLLGTGVLLTYVRTYLLAIALVTCFYFVVAQPEVRRRLARFLIWGVLLSALAAAGSSVAGGKFQTTVSAMSDRFLTLFAGKNLVQSNSLNDRQIENSYALNEIRQHPLLGIGLGQDYRPQIYGPEDDIAYYVHNVYLWLVLDFGFPGCLVFFLFYLTFLLRAFKSVRTQQDPYLRSVAAGALLMGVATLPMALVIPLFLEWHSIVVLSILIGLSESILMNHAGAQTTQEPALPKSAEAPCLAEPSVQPPGAT